MADTRRIVYVHHGKGIGGAPLSLLYLIRGLDRDAYTPSVLCLHESEASEMYRREGIETEVLRGVRDFSHTNVLWYPWWQWPKILARLVHLPFAIDRARRWLQSHPCDIVHLNTSTLLAFGIAAKRAGIKVVWHVREPLARGYFGWRRALVRAVIRHNADIVIPICRYDAEQLTPAPNIHVVYNFVDFTQFHSGIDGSAVRAELGIAPGAPVAVFLGGMSRVKGTREFVAAALRVLETKKDAVFLIAGQLPGPGLRATLSGARKYRSDVERMIPASAAASIRFIGVRRDVPQLLAAADYLVFPSTVAHFARPVIEASAMGKPVIASDIGGPRELVRDGETGLLVPPSDDAALAGAMLRLIEDPDGARRLGANGTLFAQEQFDAQKNVRRVITLYESLFE